MFKKLNVLILLATLAGAAGLVVVMNHGEQTEGLRIQGKTIDVFGQDYTLAKLAAEVGDPTVFAYDPKRREALSMASIVVHGSLQIGDPDTRRNGETLILDTVVCGDLRLEVARGGTLKVFHSDVRTKSQEITADQCSRGYALVSDGTLVAADSRFLYMSGSRSETARSRARVTLDRVIFTLSDGCSFHTLDADGNRLTIRDSTFRCEGQFGFIVEGLNGGPVVLRRCELSGQMADVALRGRNSSVELIDCRFAGNKVMFFQRHGRLAVRWTVRAKVVERGSGKPVAGVVVTATSIGKSPAEVAKATTAADGTCDLVLTEYVATPERPARQDGLNTLTPHRIVATGANGAPLAEVAAYRAEGRGGEVTLEVAPQTVAASN